MKTIMKNSLTIILSLFISMSAFSQTMTNDDDDNMENNNPMLFKGIPNTETYKTIQLINMDRDLSTFANLLALSGLGTSLALTTEPHTLIVPTNNAFAQMSIERFVELTNPQNKSKLIKFINNHFLPKKYQKFDFKERQEIFTGNNKSIEISRNGNNLYFGGANVIKSDVESANGTIYVVDNVLEPNSF